MGSNKGRIYSLNWNVTTGYKPTPWRSTVSAPPCALCAKAVFPAEEINAAGQKFHKLCLKCSTCNTLLNSGNVNEHEKKIYCVGCYRRQFGPRGVGRGLGITTAVGSSLETPPNSPNTPATNSSNPLNDETGDLDGHRYERKTSTGSSPSRTSSDEDSRHSNPLMNSVTYIGGVTTRQTLPTMPRSTCSGTSNGSFRLKPTQGNICPRCSKNVYSAEEVKAAGKSFHRACYTCAHCKKNINAGQYSEHEGELYDNNCYQRLFGPKGVAPAALAAGH